jgi:hypothetical protein
MGERRIGGVKRRRHSLEQIVRTLRKAIECSARVRAFPR